MNPNPPTWIKARRIIWPNKLKLFFTEIVARPVTQVAEVVINKASTTEMR